MENIDELLKIRQIRQFFPLSKFCAVATAGGTLVFNSTDIKYMKDCEKNHNTACVLW